MKINSYRLVPGNLAYWGDIVGNISDQKDLVEYISTHGGGGGTVDAVWGSITGSISNQSDLMNLVSSYATRSWVESQGYLSSVTLDGYATESWVESQGYLSEVPSTYATQSWVESKGYLSEVPSSYATQSWVESQGYLTEHQSLDGYATESWVESQGYLSDAGLSSYATQSWVESQGYLSDAGLSSYATQSWVESQGYLTEHQSLDGYATEAWVSSQGYLSSVPSTYATQSWVESRGYLSEVPSSYATESWVESQGYLTSTSLKTINGETLVGSGNIVISGGGGGGNYVEYASTGLGEIMPTVDVSSNLMMTYHYDSSSDETYQYDYYQGFGVSYGEVGKYLGCVRTELSTGITDVTDETFDSVLTSAELYSISSFAPLFSHKNGVLNSWETTPNTVGFCGRGTQFIDEFGQVWVWTIGGVVYGINFLTPEIDDNGMAHYYIYRFNRATCTFEKYKNSGVYVEVTGNVPYISSVTDPHFLWEDSQGRVYYNNTHQVNLTTGEFTELFPGADMGGTVQTYNGSKNNIIHLPNGIWMITVVKNQASNPYYKFDEETQTFVQVGTFAYSGTSGLGLDTFYRYIVYIDEYAYYNSNTTTMKRIEEVSDGNGGYTLAITTVTGNDRPYPLQVSLGGKNRTVSGDRVRRVRMYDSGGVYVFRYNFYYDGHLCWLTDGQWVEDTTFRVLDDFTWNPNGAEYDDICLGYGFTYGVYQKIPVWNFTQGEPGGELNIVECGWDRSFDIRLTALELNMSDAERITQNILGY